MQCSFEFVWVSKTKFSAKNIEWHWYPEITVFPIFCLQTHIEFLTTVARDSAEAGIKYRGLRRNMKIYLAVSWFWLSAANQEIIYFFRKVSLMRNQYIFRWSNFLDQARKYMYVSGYLTVFAKSTDPKLFLWESTKNMEGLFKNFCVFRCNILYLFAKKLEIRIFFVIWCDQDALTS